MNFNNLQWVIGLLNIVSRQPLLNRFIRRRTNNNRGIMWLSLGGLAISVVALALRSDRLKNVLQPIQDLVMNFDGITFDKPLGNKSVSVLAEFSKELTPNNITDKNE